MRDRSGAVHADTADEGGIRMRSTIRFDRMRHYITGLRPRSWSAVCLWAVAMVLLLLGTTASAGEVVVQNDSVVDLGEVGIVGDFLEGEHAGARLTSPCDGTIVAVQILWLEGTPGHGQSLEEAIHICDDGAFPTPGTELALLEGPVMTPGYWNEFRYLDEAQTIPIYVPVTSGQNFFVTLEFYNPTDVGNGGPSVVRDTDGCQAGKNVLYAIPGGWYNFCILITGDIAIRAIIECPGATGACCHATGICANEVEEEDCQEFGDAWHEGLTCGEITCTPRGACCRMGGCVQLVEQAACEGPLEGDYAGHGTNCDDDVCVAGACCIEATGECVSNFGFQCAALGEAYEGPGTVCDPNPCPQPQGACCFGTFCQPDQTEDGCIGAAGEWAGPWTICPTPHTDLCPICDDGDVTEDGDVDLEDFAEFQMCFDVTYTADCKCADMDNDLEVDLDDYATFQVELTAGGPG